MHAISFRVGIVFKLANICQRFNNLIYAKRPLQGSGFYIYLKEELLDRLSLHVVQVTPQLMHTNINIRYRTVVSFDVLYQLKEYN